MADTKISALTAVTTAALADQFAVNQGGTSKRETLQQALDGAGLLAASAALAVTDTLPAIQSSVAVKATVQKIHDATGSLAASAALAVTDTVPAIQSSAAVKATIQKVHDATGSLSAAAALATTDTFPAVQSSAAVKATFAQLVTLLKAANGMPRVAALASTHTVSSTTGSSTGLTMASMEAGTYEYRYNLRVQSATTTVGIGLAVNFTGTATVHTIMSMYPGTGTTAVTGVADDVGVGTGEIVEHNVQTAFATTVPNMINTAGFATINADVFWLITGIIVVTVSGDLELWHSSETATSTSVMSGSCLIVTRCS